MDARQLVVGHVEAARDPGADRDDDRVEALLELLGGDVGADGDEAAILGAPLADLQPAAIAELRLNDLGYQLQEQTPDKALAVFQLNAELYPDSPNTWDSLAEALLGAGKRAEALRAYRKVLDTVPKDTHLPPELKATLLQNAERKVKELDVR